MERQILSHLQAESTKHQAYAESGKTSPELTRSIEGMSSDGRSTPQYAEANLYARKQTSVVVKMQRNRN